MALVLNLEIQQEKSHSCVGVFVAADPGREACRSYRDHEPCSGQVNHVYCCTVVGTLATEGISNARTERRQ